MLAIIWNYPWKYLPIRVILLLMSFRKIWPTIEWVLVPGRRCICCNLIQQKLSLLCLNLRTLVSSHSEAMAHGALVIFYGEGGATETVIHGQTGLLFSEQTPVSLLLLSRGAKAFHGIMILFVNMVWVFLKSDLVRDSWHRWSIKHYEAKLRKNIIEWLFHHHFSGKRNFILQSCEGGIENSNFLIRTTDSVLCIKSFEWFKIIVIWFVLRWIFWLIYKKAWSNVPGDFYIHRWS